MPIRPTPTNPAKPPLTPRCSAASPHSGRRRRRSRGGICIQVHHCCFCGTTPSTASWSAPLSRPLLRPPLCGHPHRARRRRRRGHVRALLPSWRQLRLAPLDAGRFLLRHPHAFHRVLHAPPHPARRHGAPPRGRHHRLLAAGLHHPHPQAPPPRPPPAHNRLRLRLEHILLLGETRKANLDRMFTSTGRGWDELGGGRRGGAELREEFLGEASDRRANIKADGDYGGDCGHDSGVESLYIE
ncbi:hypothetical protein DAI22_09g171200 [Oryza sativa Japonica Group]|nr:hypothetical protein DAI22_09g171200 [Oryza sativa Japonica Group]